MLKSLAKHVIPMVYGQLDTRQLDIRQLDTRQLDMLYESMYRKLLGKE